MVCQINIPFAFSYIGNWNFWYGKSFTNISKSYFPSMIAQASVQ